MGTVLCLFRDKSTLELLGENILDKCHLGWICCCSRPVTRHKIFYGDEESSYYIWDGTNYKLYINNECVCTTPNIHEDFKELPIYQGEYK